MAVVDEVRANRRTCLDDEEWHAALDQLGRCCQADRPGTQHGHRQALQRAGSGLLEVEHHEVGTRGASALEFCRLLERPGRLRAVGHREPQAHEVVACGRREQVHRLEVAPPRLVEQERDHLQPDSLLLEPGGDRHRAQQGDVTTGLGPGTAHHLATGFGHQEGRQVFPGAVQRQAVHAQQGFDGRPVGRLGLAQGKGRHIGSGRGERHLRVSNRRRRRRSWRRAPWRARRNSFR